VLGCYYLTACVYDGDAEMYRTSGVRFGQVSSNVTLQPYLTTRTTPYNPFQPLRPTLQPLQPHERYNPMRGTQIARANVFVCLSAAAAENREEPRSQVYRVVDNVPLSVVRLVVACVNSEIKTMKKKHHNNGGI
jgi:hypothetical protein